MEERERARAMRARAGTFDPRGDSLSSCGERQQRSCQTEGDSQRGRAQLMSSGGGGRGYIKWASSVVNGCGAFDSAANQRVIYILCLLGKSAHRIVCGAYPAVPPYIL